MARSLLSLRPCWQNQGCQDDDSTQWKGTEIMKTPENYNNKNPERYRLQAMPMVLALGATLTLSLMASKALAQVPNEPIRLGIPSYNGTGCPSGTVSASVSPDNQELSILFGSFQVDAGGSSGKQVDRKACNVSIPVQVPQGFSVSMFKIDYRGYHRVPQGASGTFDVEYFFAGSSGPAYRKTFIGHSDGNFLLNNRVTAVSTVWSACGASVNLRTNTSIAVQTNNMFDQSTITLDSADIAAGVVYQLQWKRCDGGGGYNPYPTPTPYNPYPNPTPFPTPYDPYPNPGVGQCEISVIRDFRGLELFVVRDGYSREIARTSQYAEALRVAQQAEYQRSCHGIRDLVRNPYRQNHCQIMNGRSGRGQQLFRVVDRFGRIIVTTVNYQEALRLQQNDQRCFM
jgi:hypothetical protein